jgi:hypothetical protein
MSIASAIVAKQQQVADSYTAVSNKGGTLPATQDLTNLATAISSIPSGGSATLITKTITQNGTYNASSDNADGYSSVTVNVSSGAVTPTRITDDNNNEIGTWICNFTDANNNTYKVVVLDAQYRSASTQILSYGNTIPNLPMYRYIYLSNVWSAKETATSNTQLILDYISGTTLTSSACTHCRSQSFTINGVTYYGQLPNGLELIEIAKLYNAIESMDTSASSSTSTNFSANRYIWSSNQQQSRYMWSVNSEGGFTGGSQTSNYYLACPVLEIPLT